MRAGRWLDVKAEDEEACALHEALSCRKVLEYEASYTSLRVVGLRRPHALVA
jgi:hypothetical protein